LAADCESRAGGNASAAIVPRAGKSRSRATAAQRPALDEFLLLALDAAAGAVTWSHLAIRLSELTGGQAIAFLAYDTRTGQASVLAAGGSQSETNIASLIGDAGPLRGAAYQVEKWRATTDDGRQYVACQAIPSQEGSYFCIACGSPDTSESLPDGLADQIDLVLPQLARAAEIARRLSEATAQSGVSEAILDQLPFGLVQLDAGGALVHANVQAHRIVQLRNGLIIKTSGVHASNDSDEARLQMAIAEAMASRDGKFSRRLSIQRRNGTRPCSVLVTTVAHDGSATSRSTACLLYVIDPDMHAAPSPDAIAEALGITAAESRVVAALAMGVSLPDVAVKLGVSINTARTLLGRAMARTGTNSQIALVRLVLTTLGFMQREA
jgi:DNA-binding CsgD family transcriptional regulator